MMEEGGGALGFEREIYWFAGGRGPVLSLPSQFSGCAPFRLTSRMRHLIGIQPARYTASPRFRPAQRRSWSKLSGR